MPSKSKSQQRLMGQAYAFKKGDIKTKDISPNYLDKIKKLTKSMSKKQLKHFASTKHKNLPNRVKESHVMDFKSFNENIDVDIHGLKCDSPDCDYNDMSVPFEDYEKSIGKSCPKCGKNLLSQEDYDYLIKMKDAVSMIGSFDEKEINNIIGMLSQEEMDNFLDTINKITKRDDGYYRLPIKESFSDELMMGIKIEKEHNDIWKEMKDYLERFDIPMPYTEKEFYEKIARAHIDELDYNKFLLEFVETRSNTPVLYKDKNLEVKVVKTPDSAKNQGKNTNWCSNNKSGFYKHNRTANMYRFNFKDGYKLRLTWDYINIQASEDQYSGGTHWGQGGILNGKELPYTYIRPKDEDNPFDFDYKKNDRKLMVDRILSIPDEAKMSVYEYQEKNTREKNAIFNNLYKEIQKVKIIDVSEWIRGIISKIRYNDEIFYIKISLFKDSYFIPSDIDRIIKFKSTYNRGELSIYIYDKTIEYIKNNKPEIINHLEKFK